MEPKKKKLPTINAQPSPEEMAGSGIPNIPMPQSMATTPTSNDDTSLATKSGDQSYDGWCQKFVEQVTQGKTGLYPSAIAAWNKQQDKAVPSLNGVKVGDPIYFAPDASNGQFGHTGIYTGNGNFTSATDNVIKNIPIDQWTKATGQSVLGYLANK